MSLVNRMLLDLEERESAPAGAPALAGLSPVDYCVEEERRGGRQGRIAVVTTGVVLVAVTAMSVMWTGTGRTPAGNVAGAGAVSGSIAVPRPRPVPMSEMPAPAGTGAPEANVATMPSLRLDETLSWLAIVSARMPADGARGRNAEPAAGAPPDRNQVRGIALAPGDTGVVLDVRLDREARYRVYELRNPGRIVVEVDDVGLDGILPRIGGAGPVRNIRSRGERDTAVIVLDLDAPASIGGSELISGADGATLRVTIAADGGGDASDIEAGSSAPPAVAPGQLTRTPAASVQIFEDAASRCEARDIATCLARLSELLTLDPGHVQGRLLFASTLQENGNAAQAARALDEGLAAFPRHWQWAQLRAQHLANAGDTARALDVLAANPPPMADGPDYHAFMAALQQRAGRHAEAVRTYRSVLALQPDRGVWWTGLGISLQALGHDREADIAFARALADASLTPELRRFAGSRRQMLAAGRQP